MKFPLTRDKQGQSLYPDFDFTNMGLLFPNGDASEIAYMITQLRHEVRIGTGAELRPHIHFVQDVAAQPTFKLDYRLYENNGDPTGSFTTLTASTFAFTWTSGSILQIASFPAISLAAITGVSAMLDMKLYRDDTDVGGDVLAKEFDMHYQQDGWGSRQEFIS